MTNDFIWNWRRALVHRWAVFSAVCTLFLLWSGGMVTSRGVGMSVPDWPNTFGYNMFLFPVSKWVSGVFYEHTHRLIASGVGLVTAALAGLIWWVETKGRTQTVGLVVIVLLVALLGVRQMPVYYAIAIVAPPAIAFGLYKLWREPGELRWLALILISAVILQGILGGLRVAWYKDQIGIFHGLLAQAFFLTVSLTAVVTSRRFREKRWAELSLDLGLQRLVLAATILVYLQLGLGATMRHEHIGLSITDFPAAYGQILPDTSAASMEKINAARVAAGHPSTTAFQIWMQMVHRLTALTIFILVAVAWVRSLSSAHPASTRRWLTVWLLMIITQACLGATVIWTNKAADIATAHVALGALILILGGILTLRLYLGTRAGDFAWPDAPNRQMMNVA